MPSSADVAHATACSLWDSHIPAVAQLMRSLPLPTSSKLLSLLVPEVAAMVDAAAQRAGMQVQHLAADAEPDAVQQAMQTYQPHVVVCSPEVFGWVSKCMFLTGGYAIYTCGAEGQGTLLDRASHFADAASSQA